MFKSLFKVHLQFSSIIDWYYRTVMVIENRTGLVHMMQGPCIILFKYLVIIPYRAYSSNNCFENIIQQLRNFDIWYCLWRVFYVIFVGGLYSSFSFRYCFSYKMCLKLFVTKILIYAIHSIRTTITIEWKQTKLYRITTFPGL